MKTLIFFIAVLCASLSTRAAEPLPVVASFSILADLTQRVGGARVKVSALVGPNADAHIYRPTPQDARNLATARLVVVNGLGFEGWIDRLVKSSGYRGPVAVASQGIKPLKAADDGHHHHGETDPHAWLDPANARLYIRNIADALIRIDPAGQADYLAAARALTDQLDALDADIAKRFSALPAERRVVVSSHQSFGYFGRAYGITFRAPVGMNTDAGASAAEIARLIRQIRREKIPAVFLENITDARLLQRIQAETGARIGGTLYSDALSDARGPAPDYLALMRHNAETLLAALRQ